MVKSSGLHLTVSDCDTAMKNPNVSSRAWFTDPIIALLLWDVVLPHRYRASKVRQVHSRILDSLLGDAERRQPKPSRSISTILANVIPNEDMPAPDALRSWVEVASGVETTFPLQHAVDFVYVTESNARRIPRTLRDSIGTSFCCPPPTAPPTVGPRAPASAAASEVASVDSFFNPTPDEMSVSPSVQPPRNACPGPLHNDSGAPGATEPITPDEDYHSRIVRALAGQPELLLAYLDSVGTGTAPAKKRQRLEDRQALSASDKASKYSFRPTSRQVAVHDLLASSETQGTSADDFMDILISHFAVQFAPHPGVLIRLYDFQFGTRGLSVMHFGFMDRVSKMSWVKSRKANMLNFSHGVALPDAAAPASTDDIAAALSSLQTYCTAFMTTDVGDLVRCLHSFVQQEVPDVWSAPDLQHFVFWIDGVLEAFRDATVHDLSHGGNTRRDIQATIGRNNPDFQATVQLLTQRRLLELLRSNPAPPQPQRPTTRARIVEAAETGRRRQDQFSRLSRYQPEGHEASGQLRHVPRQGNQELCLRSISRSGCVGIPGSPSQCVYSNRSHFTPTSLHPEVRAYIDQRLGGLSEAFKRI